MNGIKMIASGMVLFIIALMLDSARLSPIFAVSSVGIGLWGIYLLTRQYLLPVAQDKMDYRALKDREDKMISLKRMLENETISQAEYDERIQKLKHNSQ